MDEIDKLIEQMTKDIDAVSTSKLPILSTNDKALLDDYFRNPVKRWTLEKIQDEDFKENIRDEWKYILRARRLVSEIHKKREPMDKGKILDGFYQELNRAIAQGNNYQEKVEMLMGYCNEVEQQMIDRADELMVMHNG